MLTGTLDDFSLADVLRLLSIAKKTGRLDVVSMHARGAVFFSEGDVCHAYCETQSRSLGEHLVEEGLLTAAQLDKARATASQSSQAIADVLASSGLVDAQELAAAARSLIEDAVFELWRQDEGEFSWSAGAPPATEMSLAISAENLIMEATRRKEELAALKKRLPADETIFELAPEPARARGVDSGAISLTREQWRVLALVNGRRTVAVIAGAAGLDADATMKVLHGLMAAGLVAPKGARRRRAGPVASEEVTLETAESPPTSVPQRPSPEWFDDPEMRPASTELQMDEDDVIDLDEVRRS